MKINIYNFYYFLSVIILLFSCNSKLYSKINLDSGCVANYRFSGNAIDSSGNGNNGTLIGATLIPDRFGNPNSAFQFDGVNNYIVVNSPSLNLSSNFTISVWIKTDDPAFSTDTATSDCYGWIIDIACTNGSSVFGIVSSKAMGFTNIEIEGIGSTYSNPIWEKLNYYCYIWNNHWHQITTEYDYLTDNFNMYIDGILKVSKNIGNFILDQHPEIPLLIGSLENPFPCRIGREYFKGAIDDIRIYNRALNTDEVTALYNYPQPFIDPNNGSISITSNSPLCVGNQLNLIANGPAGTTYQWTGPNGFSSNLQNPVIDSVSKMNAGIYTLVADTGQCSSTMSITVTINDSIIASIQSNYAPCSDSIALLTAYPSGSGFQYIWSTGDTTQNIKVNKSGNYSVIILNSNGCKDSSQIALNLSYSSGTMSLAAELSNGCFEIDSAYIGDNVHDKLKIINNSDKDYVISDLYLVFNVLFSIPQSQLPITVPSNSFTEIDVYFAPSKTGISFDTLIIGDSCLTLKIPLKSYGIMDVMMGNSNCNIQVKYNSVADSTFSFIIGEPYPNPASEIINIPYKKISKEFDSDIEILKLLNLLGEEQQNSTKIVNGTNPSENYSEEDGNFQIITSNLNSGLYYLTINTSHGKVMKLISVIK